MQGVEKEEVLLELPLDGHEELQTIGLPFLLIADARLVMTDDLIEESAKRTQITEQAHDQGSRNSVDADTVSQDAKR